MKLKNLKKRKTSTSIISLKGLKYIKYLPQIFWLIKNWVRFLLNYSGLKNNSEVYLFRDGTIIKTGEGIDTATIAVVYIKKDYKQILNINGDCNIIIDIGANIGIFSIYTVQNLKNTIIYAFEPEATNFRILTENIKINNFEEKIIPFQKAICKNNKDKKLYLNTSPQHSILPCFNSLHKKSKYISVKSTTLQQIFKDNKIQKCDLCKIDAEGAEYEILYNMPIKYLSKIKNLIIEYHNITYLESHNGKTLKRYLLKQGFRVTLLADVNESTGMLWCENIN